MTTKSDYSDDDWSAIITAPYIAAAVVSAADHGRSGREAEDIELAAYRQFIEKLPEAKQKNDFVRDVVLSLAEASGEISDELEGIFDFAINQNAGFDVYVGKIAEAVDIVDRQADGADAKAYKNFIAKGMEVVGQAYNESLLRLGSPISKKEGYYLRSIRRVMHI